MLRKRIALLRRRPDLSIDQFDEHWAGPHAPLIKRLPGLRRYVQNHVVPSIDHRPENAVDGIVEVWFDDAVVASPEAHFSSEQAEDEFRFLSGLTAFVVDDTADYDPPAKVWVIGGEVTPDAGRTFADRLRTALPDAREVRLNSRLSELPSMSRPGLAFEDPQPDVLVTACFDTLEAAIAARSQVEDLLATDAPGLGDVRVYASSSLRFV